jgi:hypothetical protein
MDKKPFNIISPNVIDFPKEGKDFDEQFETLIQNLLSLKSDMRALAVIINFKDGGFATSAVNADPTGVVFMSEVLKEDAMDRARGK